MTASEPTADSTPETPPPSAALPPPPPATTGGRRGALLGGVALVVAIIALAATASEPFWAPLVVPPPEKAQLAALSDRLDQAVADDGNRLRDLSQRVDALARQVAAAPAAEGADTTARLSALAGQVQDLTRRLDQAGQSQADLKAALGRTDSALAQATGRTDALAHALDPRRDAAVALVLAAGQLRGAVAEGRPYAPELAAVRAIAAGDTLKGSTGSLSADLQALAPMADRGVPTRADLARRFDAAASAAVAADRPQGGSWGEQLWNRLRALVRVRHQPGDVPGTSADAVTARAAASLQRGDLDRAVTEVAALTGPPAIALAPWLADARARLAADRAATGLDAGVLTLLAATGGTGTAPKAAP